MAPNRAIEVFHTSIIEQIAELACGIPVLAELGMRPAHRCPEVASSSHGSAAPTGHDGSTDGLEVAAASLPEQHCEGAASTEEKEEESDELGQAIERSLEDAIAVENSDVSLAIIWSKAAASEAIHGVHAANLGGARGNTRLSSQVETEVVVLVFGRTSDAWEDALLASPPAVRARELGLDIEAAWANGAKVLVPHIGAAEVEEARIELRRSHVVAWATDVGEILDALEALPARRRPRLKPADSIVTVPRSGDIDLFADASSGYSRQAIQDERAQGSAGSSSSVGHHGCRSSSQTGLAHVPLPEGHRLHIKFTFLHVDEEPSSDIPQSSRTV